MAVAFHGASSTGGGPDAFWKLFPLTCALAGSKQSLPLPGACSNLCLRAPREVGLFERRTAKPEVNVCPKSMFALSGAHGSTAAHPRRSGSASWLH